MSDKSVGFDPVEFYLRLARLEQRVNALFASLKLDGYRAGRCTVCGTHVEDWPEDAFPGGDNA